jgi:LAO/AO transport system kinase
MTELAKDILAGSRRALARALTRVENREAADLLAELYPHAGGAHLVGITGAPGTGKSTLVNRLALTLRERERTVAIVAVDPTSPFSGGAIMGDRIRMRDLAGDPGVFIRSMATRGSLGGLARTTSDLVTVLDAAGYDSVLIETVGAGQSEVDVARLAQSVVVVEAPGLGDDVQAIKAGILEIADILVVNKADDPRAKNTVRALRSMLDLGTMPDRAALLHHGRLVDAALPAVEGAGEGWEVPIHPTTATTGEGVEELADLLDAHRAHLAESGGWERRARARALTDLEARLRDALLDRLLMQVNGEELTALVDAVARRDLSPGAALERLLAETE